MNIFDVFCSWGIDYEKFSVAGDVLSGFVRCEKCEKEFTSDKVKLVHICAGKSKEFEPLKYPGPLIRENRGVTDGLERIFEVVANGKGMQYIEEQWYKCL